MISVVCWTCALLTLASARIFERCELARELHTLGVAREDISTWVCIAYHESRFDSAAFNSHSGDHGIFQISQLYWCGPGKSCGVPCSAFRDDDISDDMECALTIREEHSRFQGDGFLAWVVYPQHCKHNTKKYIIDCDYNLINSLVKTASKSLSLKSYDNNASSTYNSNIDDLRPPYLTISSFLRGGYNNLLQDTEFTYEPENWLNFKIENIDDLTLPALNKQGHKLSTLQTTTTTTTRPSTILTITSDTYKTPWGKKYVETKEFRNRAFNEVEEKLLVNQNVIHKSSPSYTNYVTSSVRKSSTSESTTVTSSTGRPTTTRFFSTSSTKSFTVLKPNSSISATVSSHTTSKPTSTRYYSTTSTKPFTVLKTTTSKPEIVTNTASKPSTTRAYFTTISKDLSILIPTTNKPAIVTTSTRKPTTIRPFLTTSMKPFTVLKNRISESSTNKPTTTRTYLTTSTKLFAISKTNKSQTTIVKTTTSKPTTKRNYSTISTKPFSMLKTSTINSAAVITTTTKPSTRTYYTTKAYNNYSNNSFIETSSFKPKPTSTFNFKPFTNWFTTIKPTTVLTNPSRRVPSTLTTRNPTRNVFLNHRITEAITYKPALASSTKVLPKTSYTAATRPTITPRPNTITTSTKKLVSKETNKFSITATNNPESYIKFSYTTPTPNSIRENGIIKLTTKTLPLNTKSKTTASPSFGFKNTDNIDRHVDTQNHRLAKTSQSIFDLYLNPTKPPKLWTFKFPEGENSPWKLKIFSDGTTTPVPKARNYVRRDVS